jgi:hypothetical protein
MKSPITSTVLSAHSMPYAPYPPVPVVYEWCTQVLANAPYYSPLPRILHSYAGFWWVTDGTRTRALRSHNPMLYRLSYGHQARTRFYQEK